MKRIILTILLSTFCSVALADNSARIKELTSEGQGLLNTRQQYTQEIQKVEVRLLEIQGALKELAALDKKTEVKAEVKSDAPAK